MKVETCLWLCLGWDLFRSGTILIYRIPWILPNLFFPHFPCPRRIWFTEWFKHVRALVSFMDVMCGCGGDGDWIKKKECNRTDIRSFSLCMADPRHLTRDRKDTRNTSNRKKRVLFSVSKRGRNTYVFFRADLDANLIMQEYLGGEQTFALASLWTQNKIQIFITCFPAQAYDNCQLARHALTCILQTQRSSCHLNDLL